MPMVGVPCVHGPSRHEPDTVTCPAICHAADGRRGRWSLVGWMFNPTERPWLLGTRSTSDRPCSRGAPRPITPDRPGGTLGAVLQTRGVPRCRWPTLPAETLVASLARPLSRPSRKHDQVRFDAPVGRRRYRSRDHRRVFRVRRHRRTTRSARLNSRTLRFPKRTERRFYVRGPNLGSRRSVTAGVLRPSPAARWYLGQPMPAIPECRCRRGAALGLDW
jgi:hypothetical protein